RQTEDGSVAFRPLEGGEYGFGVDGLTLGADATLGAGWSARVTLMGGRMGKLVNQFSGESGAVAIPEAQLVWTGKQDKVTIGRMNTYIGMEFTDGTQNITASRGLLFTYAAPFTQVGFAWRHTFTSAWSTDVFLFNGEDRIQDNNHGKTLGVGLNYNHDGASDKFFSLSAYRGAEQDGLGANANTGAEGRKRDRLSVLGQWVWGSSTLQGEFEYGREAFLPAAIAGTVGTKNVNADWMGLGLIYKHQINAAWALFARAEYFKDDAGVRLNGDTTIAAAYGVTLNADLKATSFTIGTERKWGATFSRFELRQDALNKDLTEGIGGNHKAFRNATSATLSFGTSF
ncbi:MAG: outer membrane beta-barrel protein, partial [Holophaga sp.]|nr:outer membrane beta-barrel protein [Holophaga sp.]